MTTDGTLSPSTSGRPMRRWLTWLWPILALALVGTVYIQDIEIFPASDNDEAVMLAPPYRLLTFGDLIFPNLVGRSFNNDAVQKSPPILAGWLRNVFHLGFGFSPKRSRIFSAALVLTIIGVLAVLLARSSAGPFQVSAVILTAGLQPSVVHAARTVRFEQEIFFLGMIAVCLPTIDSLFRLERRWQAILWLASGLFAAWAAGSHPWGLVYAGTIFLLACMSSKGTEWIGLRRRERVLMVALGAVIPFSIGIYPVLADWPTYRAFAEAQSHFCGVLGVMNQSLISHISPVFQSTLPVRQAAQLASLDSGAYTSQLSFNNQSLFRMFFWINIAICIGTLRPVLHQRLRSENSLLQATSLATLAFIAWHFVYNPSSGNYHLYTGFTIAIAAATAAALCWKGDRPQNPQKLKRRAAASYLGVQAAVSVWFALAHIQHVQNLAVSGTTISLDTKFRALSVLGEWANLPHETRPVLTDVNTWIVSGKNLDSMFPYVLDGVKIREEGVGGLAFNRVFASAVIEQFPGAVSIEQSPLPVRQARITELTRDLALSGLLFIRGGSSVETPLHLLFSRHDPRLGIKIALIKKEDSIQWLNTGDEIQPVNANPTNYEWNRLKAGKHLLLIQWDKARPSDLEITSGHSAKPAGRIKVDVLSPAIVNPYLISVGAMEGGSRITLRGVDADVQPFSARLLSVRSMIP